ncbi:MAG: YkgJ family cysteine cluster protein [Myxococcota bacterium]
MPSSWRDTPVPELNPLWPAPGPDGAAGERCVGCVWHFVGGRGKAVDRCRRHRAEPVDVRWPACPAFTPAVDCLTCGACCREAYHSVEVGPRDPFVRLHPDRVNMKDDGRLEVTRRGPRCACLAGGAGDSGAGDYHCVVYADRPRTCRDFPAGGQSCVEARRRVGLTP